MQMSGVRKKGKKGKRAVRDLPTKLMHESLAAEFREDPGMIDDSDLERWPPSYRLHPAVETALEKGTPLPMPFAIYLDGVRYNAPLAGRTDSVLGIWVYFLATGRRHLLVFSRGISITMEELLYRARYLYPK